MPKLPKSFDLRAIRIKDLLHHGKRDEALAMLDEAVARGAAGEETRALAEYLKSAGRGRQPFGATHLWIEIGEHNDEMRDQGMGYADRLEKLGVAYILNTRQIKTALAKYERAMDYIRSIDYGQ